jgi:hypothetical protein
MSVVPELAPILQAGIGLFAGSTALIAVAFVYFVWATSEVAKRWDPREYDIKLSRSTWLYLGAFTISVGALWLYLDQYFSQGFAVKPDETIIIWERWLFYAVLYLVTTYVLANQMSHQNDEPRKHEKAGGDAQAWFCSLYALVSAVALYKATIAQSRESSALSASISLVLFVLAVAMLFFPRDMIWGEDYMAVRDIIFSESSTWRVLTRSLPKKHRENSIVVWAFVYRFVLFVQWVLAYAAMLVVWFLADGQFFSTALNLRDTCIAFLVCDAVFVVPFQLLLVYLTFKNVVKKVTAEDRQSGHVHFAQPVHQHEQL